MKRGACSFRLTDKVHIRMINGCPLSIHPELVARLTRCIRRHFSRDRLQSKRAELEGRRPDSTRLCPNECVLRRHALAYKYNALYVTYLCVILN